MIGTRLIHSSRTVDRQQKVPPPGSGVREHEGYQRGSTDARAVVGVPAGETITNAFAQTRRDSQKMKRLQLRPLVYPYLTRGCIQYTSPRLLLPMDAIALSPPLQLRAV